MKMMCEVRMVVLYQFRERTYWTSFSFEISDWKHEKRCDAFWKKKKKDFHLEWLKLFDLKNILKIALRSSIISGKFDAVHDSLRQHNAALQTSQERAESEGATLQLAGLPETAQQSDAALQRTEQLPQTGLCQTRSRKQSSTYPG